MNHDLVRGGLAPPPLEEPWNHFFLSRDSRGDFPRCGPHLTRRIVGQIEKVASKLDDLSSAQGFSFLLLPELINLGRNASRRFNEILK